MNDPNGLCFWQGLWHLFYQAYPPEDPRQHWGHAVSADLIHWRDLPYAIKPGPEDCCFSGATFVEDDRVIAMYHGTQVGNLVAISSDPLLLNWEKLTGKAVIPSRSPDGSTPPYSVFDPCIWKKDGLYYSLSAGTLPHGPSGKKTRAEFLFRSRDLKTWEYLHPFVEGDIFGLVGDFSAVTEEGVYQIHCGSAKSRPVLIHKAVYDQALWVLFNYYPTQRYGDSLTGWNAPCHLVDARRADTGDQMDLVGGWHQSGDLRQQGSMR